MYNFEIMLNSLTCKMPYMPIKIIYCRYMIGAHTLDLSI